MKLVKIKAILKTEYLVPDNLTEKEIEAKVKTYTKINMNISAYNPEAFSAELRKSREVSSVKVISIKNIEVRTKKPRRMKKGYIKNHARK